ncbi:probable U3 small nucleolar RNA-associated protein 11 [Populus trichocarpa]|uniref:probable U3 small nucleolar RNA-associated protein 11 n=1 Tax=Populus trichocarpa TaxID=3694 RepID=UPI0022783983|nr:probable U3 small nucleolar RNA-associated protein 11 [Populus trichocarpa]
MSSLKNAIPRRAHKERANEEKIGLLEKHKDYVDRAKAFHKKKEALRRLKEKAASRNPDEFYFGMIKSRTVGGVHRPQTEANKYSQEELMLMKTQDTGYVLQKEKEARETWEEAKEMKSRSSQNKMTATCVEVPDNIKRKMACSYRELEARKNRSKQLEKIYMDMALQKELQKKGQKRKLREDEIDCPPRKPVFKWRPERKR